MKFIEDLRGKHKGKDIWVIGAGPSLDAYPLDFFEDKICIGVNWVFSVFINIGDKHEKFKNKEFYSVHEHRQGADWIARNRPDYLKNCFFLLPPKRRAGKDLGHQMVWWEDYNDDPYYMRWGLKGVGAVHASDADFAAVAKCISNQQECHYVCRGTTLHWAIQAAVVLGAQKIYVVGSEAQGGHMCKHGSKYAADKRRYNHPHWVTGTRALAKAFEPYGIEIVAFYYPKGEQRL